MNLPYKQKEEIPNTENIKIHTFNPEDIDSEVEHCFNKKMNIQLSNLVGNLDSLSQNLAEPRRIIQHRINQIVKKTFKSDKIFVQEYGSVITGLLTPFSDLDLAIQGCYMLNKAKAIEILEILNDNLKLFKFVKNTSAILTAAVPVIKLEADPSIHFEDGEIHDDSVIVEVDIIVDLIDELNYNSTALRTTEYIKQCSLHYPTFHENVLFLKYVMHCNQLCITYKGGLNAYGMCILYVAFLEFKNKENDTNAFELLMDFLNFFANEFNPDVQAVCFGNMFSQIKNPFVSKSYFEPSYLTIIDPTSVVPKNVTLNCTMIKGIQAFLGEAHKIFRNVALHLIENVKRQEIKTQKEIEEVVEQFVSQGALLNTFNINKPESGFKA